jgi:hypothetical protein
MDDWYTIGLCLGLGLGLGLLLAGLLAVNTAGTVVAALGGLAAGAFVGYVVEDTAEMIAGVVGGLVGALAASVVVRGAFRRGATRIGLAAWIGAVGLLVFLLAFVPIAGYVLTVALPALALRMRGREAARFAGLRTLAK